MSYIVSNQPTNWWDCKDGRDLARSVKINKLTNGQDRTLIECLKICIAGRIQYLHLYYEDNFTNIWENPWCH